MRTERNIRVRLGLGLGIGLGLGQPVHRSLIIVSVETIDPLAK
jgi:hypothetical protein